MMIYNYISTLAFSNVPQLGLAEAIILGWGKKGLFVCMSLNQCLHVLSTKPIMQQWCPCKIEAEDNSFGWKIWTCRGKPEHSNPGKRKHPIREKDLLSVWVFSVWVASVKVVVSCSNDGFGNCNTEIGRRIPMKMVMAYPVSQTNLWYILGQFWGFRIKHQKITN